MLTEFALKMIDAPRTEDNPITQISEQGFLMCRFDEIRIATDITGPTPETSVQMFWRGERVSVKRFGNYNQAMGDSLILTQMHGWLKVSLERVTDNWQ